MAQNVTQLVHPSYDEMISLWEEYRLCGTGGEEFLNTYLIKRDREENFEKRKALTYIPAYAKASLQEINNSLCNRLSAVKRIGGDQRYKTAVSGNGFGVDRRRASMNQFMGKVISELTMMGAVGVYVDAPVIGPEATLKDEINKAPYFYTYQRENILNWKYSAADPSKFDQILLKDWIETSEEEYGLTTAFAERYRLYNKIDGGVRIFYFNDRGERTDRNLNKSESFSDFLQIPEIPFVMFELSHSLLADVCRHQIALLNLGSADMSFLWNSNTVFLAEHYDPNSAWQYFNRPDQPEEYADRGEEDRVKEDARGGRRVVGTDISMRVPKDFKYPEYVTPPSDSVDISMKKAAELKDDIRSLINQNLRTVSSKATSTEVRKIDDRKEEDGLKVIGDEAESGERRLAEIYHMYLRVSNKPEINYPRSYSFKTDRDKRDEIKEISEIGHLIPSKAAQAALGKKMANLALEGEVSQEILEQIYKEIEASPSAIADPELINKFVENDIISPETAALQAGFSKEEAKKAEESRIRRAKAIAEAQSTNKPVPENAGARGVEDLSVNPTTEARMEKE